MRVTLHKHATANGQRWVVGRFVNGKRERSFFKTRTEAEAEASRLRLESNQAGEAWLLLSPEKRQRLMMVWTEAERKGLDLEALVKAGKPKVISRNIGVVIRELLDVKERAGRSEPYVTALESILGAFSAGREQIPLADFGLPECESFLDLQAPASRSTVRARLSTLFNFAVRRGYVTANPCARIEPQTCRKPSPAIFTPEQVRRCLQWLRQRRPRALPWFVLSTFCGLRPEEAEKTTWAAVNFTEGWIRVEAQTSKIGERRVVYPLPEAIALLKSAKELGGELPLNKQARRRTIRLLRNHLGWEKWPKDVTRHSAASYWLAVATDEARLAEALGHSVRVLHRNYKALVTHEEARKFWKAANTTGNP